MLHYYCLVKKQKQTEKKTIAALAMMVCVRVVSLRVPSSCCCGSPWPPHCLSSLGPLICTCSRWHSLPVGSPSPPYQKTKCSSQLAVLIGKTKILGQGEFNPSLPRRSTASCPPPSLSNPASSRRSSLHANRDCAGVWLVVAPASAHEHPD